MYPRRHQAEGAIAPGGALTDGVHVRIRRLAAVVDGDAAAAANLQPALTRQLVLGADAGGEHDEIHFQQATVGEMHGFARCAAAVDDLLGIFAGVYLDAHALDLAAQLVTAHRVELFGHQHRSELDHVRFHPQAFQRTGGFQPQQPAADYRTAFAAARTGFDGVQVFDGAVNEAVLAIRAFNRRDPRIGAGGHDQLVVIDGAAGVGVDHLLVAIDGDGALADQHLHAVFFRKSLRAPATALRRCGARSRRKGARDRKRCVALRKIR